MRRAVLTLLSILLTVGSARAAETFTVALVQVADEKAVFATVESRNVVPARTRIGGMIETLGVRAGDSVERGQVVATIGDEKIVLRMQSLDAQIAGLEAQQRQARIDLDRAETLFKSGTIARARLDEARTAFNVADNALRSRLAERSVIGQQLTEGSVLAPNAGRVLSVPLTAGAVIQPGEAVAMIAEGGFVLRLRVPERHARFLKVGDPVRIDATESGKSAPRFGSIRLIYPRIEDGRIVADATVGGLDDYFIGERLRVWIAAGEHKAFVVPAAFIRTLFGIDYARLQQGAGLTIDVPVQRGRDLPRPTMPDGMEILSGLRQGDVLVRP